MKSLSNKFSAHFLGDLKNASYFLKKKRPLSSKRQNHEEDFFQTLCVSQKVRTLTDLPKSVTPGGPGTPRDDTPGIMVKTNPTCPFLGNDLIFLLSYIGLGPKDPNLGQVGLDS